jgi:hypothetical protein
MKHIFILFIAFILISTVSVQGEIIAIRISPDHVSLNPGQSYRFVARGVDSLFGEMNVQPIWIVEGQGRITPDGLYTAGYNVGQVDIIKAIYPGRRIHGVAKVVVGFKHATPYPPHPGYIPPKPYPPHHPRPGYVPPRPGYNPPHHPGVNPPHRPNPGFTPNRPGYNPNRPGFTPNRPGYNPNRPGYNPNRPGFTK